MEKALDTPREPLLLFFYALWLYLTFCLENKKHTHTHRKITGLDNLSDFKNQIPRTFSTIVTSVSLTVSWS